MKKITVLIAVAVMLVGMWLPANAYSQERGRGWRSKTMTKTTIWDGQRRGRRRYQGRNRIYYGYRNYGQYRRTQVGNRRFRMVKRTFWRNGIRTTRMVRVYY